MNGGRATRADVGGGSPDGGPPSSGSRASSSGSGASTAVVALDGPAGSGKSTVARRVAEALGWRFVDTGATYRAVTLAVLRGGVDPQDPAAVAAVAGRSQVALGTRPGEPAVTLDGEDVSTEIRGAEVTAAVSAVSSVPAVRELMVELQRRAIGAGRAVVEGRDIATVVAPQAAVKVYLDARPEVRARRRAGDADAGVRSADGAGAAAARDADALHDEVLRSLERRDALDDKTNRLRATQGAVDLDTSDLTLDEVVAAVVALVHAAGVTGGTP